MGLREPLGLAAAHSGPHLPAVGDHAHVLMPPVSPLLLCLAWILTACSCWGWRCRWRCRWRYCCGLDAAGENEAPPSPTSRFSPQPPFPCMQDCAGCPASSI
jgi:hypothetical protein